MKYWDRAWSLVDGCTPVSAACDHCWLAGMTHRFGHTVTPDDGINKPLTDFSTGNFNGTVICRMDRLDLPLHTKKPTVWAIWSDLFHEKVPDDFIHQVLDVMTNPMRDHIFLVLTKRTERMAAFLGTVCKELGPVPDNIWFGVTVENQEQADKRIPELLKVPGNRFLSVEPMLGPVEIPWRVGGIGPFCSSCTGTGHYHDNFQTPCPDCGETGINPHAIHCVICGGESGPGARPLHPDWVRYLRDQCAAAGIPFTFKQWGKGKKLKDGYYMTECATDAPVLDGKEYVDLPWRKS